MIPIKPSTGPVRSGILATFVPILTMAVVASPWLQAQELEEVVVTAQRRAQSLQDVPISIDAISGEELSRQGYRDLVGLSDFTPGVEIRPLLEDTRVTIRGFGTTGNNLTQEQAVPIFVDGVHLGRQEQAKLAFMDVERLEVLKGPQPVFFGQNATSGAFNIISRKPTPTWEGNVEGELGNNQTQKLSGGVGGPINDTWGIRIAGRYETSDGYLVDAVDGMKGPHYENMGGRIILQWTPTDNFQATLKHERVKLDMGGQAGRLCLTGASMIWGRNGPGETTPQFNGVFHPQGQAVWQDPPLGTGWAVPHKPLPNANDKECFTSNIAVSNSGPYYDVPDYVREEAVTNVGMLDVRAAAEAFTHDETDPAAGGRYKGIHGYEDLKSNTSYLDLSYEFANGISVDSLTAYSSFVRGYVEDNRSTPFFTNFQGRGQKLDQWSTELRFTSPTGGMFEWMTGASWQINDYDIYSGNMRNTVFEAFRMNNIWEDTEWKNIFATITFNFLDNKASIDVGGRYSDIEKSGLARGYTAQWVMNVEPVTGPPGYAQITDPATARIYLPYDEAAGLWYYPYRVTRNTPPEWWGTARAHAVGTTMPDYAGRADGPYFAEFNSTEFDPQVTLRYRWNDDLSFFGRWAQAFKSGGFDTGQTTFSNSFDDFVFGPETSETFEIGTKGNLWDGRARFDVTLFQTSFSDLQTITLSPDPLNPSNTVNAGGQRVRGAEFGILAAVSEQMTVGLNGALMDGVMTDYKGAGCNDFEVETAPESGCVLVNPTDPTAGGRIDRSGSDAPYTPTWKFSAMLDYWQPVFENHKIIFNAKGYISDGYFDDGEGFTQTVLYSTHGDVNLSLGYGDREDVWRVSLWARNLLHASPRYHPENTVSAADTGWIQIDTDQTQYTTYGVKIEYNYR